MFSQQLVEPVVSLVVQLWCLGNRGTNTSRRNTLSMELFDDVNQRMHQLLIIKTERVILSCLDIIFPDLDKADVVVGKVAEFVSFFQEYKGCCITIPRSTFCKAVVTVVRLFKNLEVTLSRCMKYIMYARVPIKTSLTNFDTENIIATVERKIAVLK